MFDIDVRNITKRFGHRKVLDSVRLRVRPGVTGLLGPNGSGKSTLIKALLGLLRADGGEGTVLGLAWPSQVRAIRESVGYLPEDDCYIIGLQGVEAVQMMARLSGLPRTEALRRAHEVLDYCDMGQERYRPVETYSTGMRQKLKFAQCLVHDPRLIILDEPTTGLDPSQRDEFLQRIATLAKHHGKTILLSTHILHDVRQVCDDVIILVKGRIQVEDSLENLSCPVESGLFIKFLNDMPDAASRFCSAGLQSHTVSSNCIRVVGASADGVGEIWRVAATMGAVVQSVEPIRRSLEDIFIEAVGEAELGDT